ncbi:hypothetical protein ABEX78_19800 [Priestia megaterium]
MILVLIIGVTLNLSRIHIDDKKTNTNEHKENTSVENKKETKEKLYILSFRDSDNKEQVANKKIQVEKIMKNNRDYKVEEELLTNETPFIFFYSAKEFDGIKDQLGNYGTVESMKETTPLFE